MRKVSEDFYSLSAKTLENKEFFFKDLQGKVVLIVNTATRCNLSESTLNNLHSIAKKYKNKEFRILIFPCSQFMNQEEENKEKMKATLEKFLFGNKIISNNQDEIKNENTHKHDDLRRMFIIFDKVDVKGKDQHIVFKFLTTHLKGSIIDAIKWNYTKFLIDQNGIPTKRYGPMDPVEVDDPLIKDLLNEL